VFLALWMDVVTGQHTLIGGDILSTLPPWAHGAVTPPRNATVSDPVTQYLPWQHLVRDAWLHGRIPQWNPGALSGAPLLANDESAPFSPFTLVALPFDPARGLTIAMLSKLLVAGVGMGVFVRLLGVRRSGAVVAAVAYAGCSFMVVWMGHPQSSVAAIMPWAFAAVEWYLRSRGAAALVCLAAAIALQFMSGHAQTSLHFGLFLTAYALIRWAAQHRAATLGGLALAGVLGTALAGAQLVPFIAELHQATLLSSRAGAGFGHLQPSALASWLVPNAHGNPGIDGLTGRAPNYLESTGFVGVVALLLVLPGVVWAWRRQRSVAIALGLPTVLAFGVVYGVLSPIAGRIPGLSTSNNARLIAVACFGLAALAGLGVEGLLSWRPRAWPLLSGVALGAGGAALAALAALGIVLWRRGGGVDALLPTWHGMIGFWVVVAALSAGAGLLFIAATLAGRSLAGAGIVATVVVETAIFAAPFQPRVPPAEVPPASPTIAWLQQHAGNSAIAGAGMTFLPDTSELYGLRDARGIDLFLDPRTGTFWRHADPGYDDHTFYTLLSRPGAEWLAAAGVHYYVAPPGATVPGTTPVYEYASAVVAEVPDVRPFAFTAPSVSTAANADQAATAMAADPLGAVVVETSATMGSAPGNVRMLRQDPGSVDVAVDAEGPTTLVVLQSYAPGWTAKVDGGDAPVWPADVLFQAVPVGAGHHVVALRYQPASMTQGIALSAAGLAGCVGLATLFPLVRKRNKRV